jgi:hypothetical protein
MACNGVTSTSGFLKIGELKRSLKWKTRREPGFIIKKGSRLTNIITTGYENVY